MRHRYPPLRVRLLEALITTVLTAASVGAFAVALLHSL